MAETEHWIPVPDREPPMNDGYLNHIHRSVDAVTAHGYQPGYSWLENDVKTLIAAYLYQRAENARLRERVAELDGMLAESLEHLHE